MLMSWRKDINPKFIYSGGVSLNSDTEGVNSMNMLIYNKYFRGVKLAPITFAINEQPQVGGHDTRTCIDKWHSLLLLFFKATI